MNNRSNIAYCGNSNMGLVRTNNEDAFISQNIWNKEIVLAVAIDGVGGYEGGEVAAAIAKQTITEYLSVSDNGERVELLKQAVTAANNAIYEARESDQEHSQMSCVLTAAIIDTIEKQVSMVHVGDTRLYSYHQGVLTKLSHDHSLIGYREEIGDLTEEEAMHHPKRNEIGRDVGSQKHNINDDDFIEANVFKLEPNTTFLLCSDGLTDMITSTTIKAILSGKDSISEKTSRLIKAALDAGGKDNVTVVLVDFQSEEATVAIESSDDNDEEEQIVKNDPNGNECGTTYKKHRLFNWLTIILVFVIGFLFGIYVMCYYENHKNVDNKNLIKQESTILIGSINENRQNGK